MKTKELIEQDIRNKYEDILPLLKEDLPAVPLNGLRLSGKVKRAWGKLKAYNVHTGPIKPIEVIMSSYCFEELYTYRLKYQGDFWGTSKSYDDKLIETICHEFAHITHWDHGSLHKELTQKYIDKVTGKVRTLENTKAQLGTKTSKLADLCEDPKKARAALRKAGIQKPGSKWEWEGAPPKEVIQILKGLK